jgi:hypothetical protein
LHILSQRVYHRPVAELEEHLDYAEFAEAVWIYQELQKAEAGKAAFVPPNPFASGTPEHTLYELMNGASVS